MSPAIQIRKDI